MKGAGSKPKCDAETQKKITKEFLSTEVSRAELAERYAVSVGTIDNYVRRYRNECEVKV